MSVLLDANVLIALMVADHVHHEAAEGWFVDLEGSFATCPITQGSLMRMLMREGYQATEARALLADITAHARHEFWADDVSYASIPVQGIIGHGQVTDAYLASLARTRQARIATFDMGLAKLHADVADLIPVS